MNFIEKRDYTRMKILYEIQCKQKGDREAHQAWCTTLSGSGISFLTQYEFDADDEIKVSVLPEKEGDKQITFTIKVVRCSEKENGFFEVAGVLNRMRDSEFAELSYRLNG